MTILTGLPRSNVVKRAETAPASTPATSADAPAAAPDTPKQAPFAAPEVAKRAVEAVRGPEQGGAVDVTGGTHAGATLRNSHAGLAQRLPVKVDAPYIGSLDDFAQDLVDRANSTGRVHTTRFNKVDLLVKPGDSAAGVLAAYDEGHRALPRPAPEEVYVPPPPPVPVVPATLPAGTIAVRVRSGESVDETIEGIVEKANRTGLVYGAIHNNVPLVARPGDTFDKLIAAWEDR